MRVRLGAYLDELAMNDGVKVVLLRGEGGNFSTGADMGNAYRSQDPRVILLSHRWSAACRIYGTTGRPGRGRRGTNRPRGTDGGTTVASITHPAAR